MPILHGLSTKNKAAITANGKAIQKVFVGARLVWQLNSLSGLGLLYNMAAVTDPRQLAPEGYRVANTQDIVDLIAYLGGDALAGGDMKALTAWTDPNTGATNASGLTALPAGHRDNLGNFAGKLLSTKIWIDNR